MGVQNRTIRCLIQCRWICIIVWWTKGLYIMGFNICWTKLLMKWWHLGAYDRLRGTRHATKMITKWRLQNCQFKFIGTASVHSNATGIPLVDPVYTGIPLGNTIITCRVHWNTTGKTYLEQNFCSQHWNTTGGTVTANTRPGTYS